MKLRLRERLIGGLAGKAGMAAWESLALGSEYADTSGSADLTRATQHLCVATTASAAPNARFNRNFAVSGR
jgi:hypothetical protein